MKLLSRQQSVTTLLLTLGSLQLELAPRMIVNAQQQNQLTRNRLIDKCCQVGKERAIESSKFNCKLSAREALLGNNAVRGPALSGAETMLAKDSSLSDECELVLESCCVAYHRNKNCDSGKQFAKSGSYCMDVELSKEATIATESFNDCCMSCSLGILAAKNPGQNETINIHHNQNHQHHHHNRQQHSTSSNNVNFASRCKLSSPLASSLSGQLYEQTYVECCQENLPRVSGALTEPGAPIDCLQSNPCSQRCVTANSFLSSSTSSGGHPSHLKRDRCDCFSGYKLASDGINCLDIDECKLNTHTCNRLTEICDNTKGAFRCLARDFASSDLVADTFGGENRQDPPSSSSSSSSSSWDRSLVDSTQEFSSLRLCPLGYKWDHQENRCLQISSSPSMDGFGPTTTSQQRSASLVFAGSSQSNNNQHQPLARIISSSWS